MPSGVVSTIFLWMVDIDKSRVECAQFVLAEAQRKAFKAVRSDVSGTDVSDNSK